MLKNLIFLFSIATLFISCKTSVNPEDLYGKWKYVKVEHTHDATDTLRSTDLAYQAPYILFSKNNDYIINWGGKVLSNGHFTTDGMNIRIKENLPDGNTRDFPFWVVKITGKELVFETKGEDGTKVTAVR